jgi:AsmA-like C-terminal region
LSIAAGRTVVRPLLPRFPHQVNPLLDLFRPWAAIVTLLRALAKVSRSSNAALLFAHLHHKGHSVQAIEDAKAAHPSSRGHHRLLLWIGISIVLLLILCAIFLTMAGRIVQSMQPMVKERVMRSLGSEFGGRVFLDQFRISVADGLRVEGSGLRIYAAQDESDQSDPVIAVRNFDLRTSWTQAILDPLHVNLVHVHGLAIDIPPPGARQHPSTGSGGLKKTWIRIDDMVCDQSSLTINSANAQRVPKFFGLKRIEFHDIGATGPSSYEALLINAVPVGEIRSSGTFGPWNADVPGDTNVTGKYVFDHADLYPIKGIGGLLHSDGTFAGPLDRVTVQGTAEVPNFSLDTANRPLPLETEFSAVVDGTTGDTYLHAIAARLGGSNFTCEGSIVHQKGQGHDIDLNVDVPGGRIQDFLELSVKTWPTIMTGVIRTKAHLHIKPGKQSVSQNLDMTGTFSLAQIHFTNPKVEDKVDMLSLRASGKPELAKPGASDVRSEMTGSFHLKNGTMDFDNLNYGLPGADIQLTGQYSLDGRKYEFTGKARTKAEISQMVDSKWKSILLKPLDPFFHKHGAGAEIPIKISGTDSEPHFGLKLGKDDSK